MLCEVSCRFTNTIRYRIALRSNIFQKFLRMPLFYRVTVINFVKNFNQFDFRVDIALVSKNVHPE